MQTIEIVPSLITWDPKLPREIDEAKGTYREAKAKGYDIADEDGAALDHFPALAGVFRISEVRKPGRYGFRVLDETGDRRLTWDSEDPVDTEEAATMFKDYLKKGYRAYAVSLSDPKVKGPRIFGFDAKTEEVIFDDTGTLKEKLKTFVKKFQQVNLTPKTVPG